MRYILLLVVAAGLLAGLLYAEKTGHAGLVLGFKTPLSILFVLVALLLPHPVSSYFRYVLGGLILGLIGDVCLALPGKQAFMVGLAAFLIGHMLYVVAFAGLVKPTKWLSPVVLLMVVASGAVFWWLRPHVGTMLVPVALYTVVITVMLAGAWAVFRSPDVATLGAWVVFLGALLFYVSDIFVARDRFVTHEFLNRLIGLPLYYTAQFLLAFSVKLIK